ncbi:MAG: hypothetical protein ABSC41_18225 [Acidimicrobiales bacterium]
MEFEWLAVEGDPVSVGDVDGDVGVGDLIDEQVVGRFEGNEAGEHCDDTDADDPCPTLGDETPRYRGPHDWRRFIANDWWRFVEKDWWGFIANDWWRFVEKNWWGFIATDWWRFVEKNWWRRWRAEHICKRQDLPRSEDDRATTAQLPDQIHLFRHQPARGFL